MNPLSKIVVAILTLAVTAGCSRESKAKEAALEAAQARFEEKLHKELAEKISGRDNIRKTYVGVITRKTEFRVDELVLDGASARFPKRFEARWPISSRRIPRTGIKV